MNKEEDIKILEEMIEGYIADKVKIDGKISRVLYEIEKTKAKYKTM